MNKTKYQNLMSIQGDTVCYRIIEEIISVKKSMYMHTLHTKINQDIPTQTWIIQFKSTYVI